MTSFVEMSKICSVPISFLVLRGQGIKLTSYIGNNEEKDTLMPLILDIQVMRMKEQLFLNQSAILFDNPVACVDYSTLPSSIISENISHDSMDEDI